MRGLMKTALVASVLCLGAVGSANAGSLDGISYLIAVTQEKTDRANEQATNGASDQHSLIEQQRQARARQSAIEESTPAITTARLCRVCLTSHQPVLTRTVDNDDEGDDDSDD